MKLYYHDDFGEVHNFGDALNGWLWPQLLPGILDDNPSTAFIGMGTLINDQLNLCTPQASKRILFSTGVGYSKTKPTLDDSYSVYCVRGPLSAQELGLSPNLAITDGAILVHRLYTPPTSKPHPYAFMPHIESVTRTAWQSVCDECGVTYIDPCWPIERTLDAIGSTQTLLAEAMHGAIVADALRVPWIPIVTASHILAFKWEDWCRSMEVPYQPQSLPHLWDCNDKQDPLMPIRKLKYALHRAQTASRMKQLLKTASPILSSSSTLERQTQRIEEALEQFKTDVRQGAY